MAIWCTHVSDGFLKAHLLYLDERAGWLIRLMRQVECVLAGLGGSENRIIEAFQKQLDEVTDLLRLRFAVWPSTRRPSSSC